MRSSNPLFAAGLLCALCLLMFFAFAAPALANDGATLIGRSHFLLVDDETPPAMDRPWADVTLPDNWSESRMAAEGIGWYRVDFDLPAAPAPQLAVLIRRLSMNGEIFVNGTRLMSGGRMQPPVTQNWNVPFFVEIPAPLLRTGSNELHVRIFAYRNSNCGLGRVWIGPANTLRPHYLSVHALHVKGSIVSFAVALVAAFIGAVAWWRMGREPLYGLFGLAMACWAVRYANYFVQDVPLDKLAYSVAVNSAQGWFFVFFTPFLLRLAGLHRPWVGRGLLLMGLAGTIAIWAAFGGWLALKVVIVIWAFVWLPGSLALLAVSARFAWQERSARSALAALVVWLYVPLTLRELLITSNMMPFDASYIAHYVGIPLALLIAWMLVDHAADAVRRAAQAEVARTRAAFDERQRITQDMHDGLGLQLNATLRVVERGEFARSDLAAMLRWCLDELRLIVDSTTAEGDDFLPLLASLRIRLQARLEAAGLRVDWRMDSFPSQLRLPPDTSLQVLRIVQEAINNTIKHANASSIEFSMAEATAAGRVVLQVRDNGNGFAPDAPTVGKGLAGMKRRAAKASVDLEIQTTGGGTCIRMEFPCQPAAQPAAVATAALP